MPHSTITDENDVVMQLEWQSAPMVSQMAWKASIDSCRALTTSDHTNWRLPTIEEMQSIIASGVIELTDKELWSRCSSSSNYSNADVIDENNNITSVQKTELKYVLAVRTE